MNDLPLLVCSCNRSCSIEIVSSYLLVVYVVALGILYYSSTIFKTFAVFNSYWQSLEHPQSICRQEAITEKLSSVNVASILELQSGRVENSRASMLSFPSLLQAHFLVIFLYKLSYTYSFEGFQPNHALNYSEFTNYFTVFRKIYNESRYQDRKIMFH